MYLQCRIYGPNSVTWPGSSQSEGGWVLQAVVGSRYMSRDPGNRFILVEAAPASEPLLSRLPSLDLPMGSRFLVLGPFKAIGTV